jgi:hypothetical protein
MQLDLRWRLLTAVISLLIQTLTGEFKCYIATKLNCQHPATTYTAHVRNFGAFFGSPMLHELPCNADLVLHYVRGKLRGRNFH